MTGLVLGPFTMYNLCRDVSYGIWDVQYNKIREK